MNRSATFPRLRVLAVSLLLAGLLISCGQQDDRKPVHPVRGKVLYKKTTPAEGARVVFWPVGESEAGKGWPQGFPSATVARDGSFALTTYANEDGAPQGEYYLLIEWRLPNPKNEEETSPNKLHERYSKQDKARRATVKAGPNDVGTIYVD